jgi:hypothetical protein
VLWLGGKDLIARLRHQRFKVDCNWGRRSGKDNDRAIIAAVNFELAGVLPEVLDSTWTGCASAPIRNFMLAWL